MRQFKDSQDKPWSIDINVESIMRVRDTGPKVNLLTIIGGDLLPRIGEDPMLVFDIVWCLVEPEAKAAAITVTQFASRMRGEQLKGASEALLEELVDFFQQRGPALTAAIEKVRALEATIVEAVVTQINGPDMDKLLQSELGKISGSLPESSASIPGSSPIGSSK